MNIVGRLKKLNLPLGQRVVVGSGILDALGIRPAHDIDLADAEIHAATDFQEKFFKPVIVK